MSGIPYIRRNIQIHCPTVVDSDCWLGSKTLVFSRADSQSSWPQLPPPPEPSLLLGHSLRGYITSTVRPFLPIRPYVTSSCSLSLSLCAKTLLRISDETLRERALCKWILNHQLPVLHEEEGKIQWNHSLIYLVHEWIISDNPSFYALGWVVRHSLWWCYPI